MNLYFISEYPCAVKINGLYFTSVSSEIKSIKVDDAPFIEICSLSTAQPNVNFFPNQEFFDNLPKNVCVTDLKGGYLISLKKSYKDISFGVIGQQKFNNCIITLFAENGIKLSVETPYDFYAEELLFEPSGLKAQKIWLNSTELLLVELTGEKKVIMLFSLNNKLIKLFEREIDSYNISNGFTTTEKIYDIAKHTVEIDWEYSKDKINKLTTRVSRKEGFSISDLNERILPYAFIEEFFIGGEYLEYLSSGIIANSKNLKSYFGDFIGIMPPPLFREENEIGLIYQKSSNFYCVEYFTFILEDRLISNIIKK